MGESAVIFDHVSKKFRRGERHDSFRDLIPAAVRRLTGRAPATDGSKEFWAVNDVSFSVAPGEALGIIGPNGAGKSTVLKLLTRILRPTSGVATVRGRVGALIEVAAGFHPDLTGRENVYLQGAIMGMKRAEISAKFDQIVEFSGVSEFIDTPVKRYSSGMNARLGFAIAAHLDPDVLLIDEVLAVGDAAFQDKCLARMRELVARGLPMIFISHNLPAVIELCTRTIVLQRGAVRFDGDPAEAVSVYCAAANDRNAPSAHTGPIWITSVEIIDDNNQSGTVFRTGGSMRVRIGYEASQPVERPQFAVDIHRADGVYCAGINTRMAGQNFGVLEGQGVVELTIPNLPVLPGYYLASVGILHGSVMTPYDVHMRAYPFSVLSDSRQFGVMHVDHAWEHRPARIERPAASRNRSELARTL
jgi:lipopolysaccharide transport system ATP-binding protein